VTRRRLATTGDAHPDASAEVLPDPLLDSHVHFWDPHRLRYPWLGSVPALDRAFLPEHLPRDVPVGTQLVVVEADRLAAQAGAEVGWLRGMRAAGAPIAAVVAHTALEKGEGCAGSLTDLAADPAVAGVRRLLQDEPGGFALREGFAAGAFLLARTGLVLDLCVRRHQLAEAAELVRRRPELMFVLDHLGKPEVSPASFRPWSEDLSRLAALPNVVCKLSGLATEAAPDRRAPQHLLPFLREAIDLFGPGRCMFGSDWPVLTLAMSYGRWLDLVREAVGDLAPDQRADVLHRTARGVYRTDGFGDPTSAPFA
jgi:L-fuconolactonase